MLTDRCLLVQSTCTKVSDAVAQVGIKFVPIYKPTPWREASCIGKIALCGLVLTASVGGHAVAQTLAATTPPAQAKPLANVEEVIVTAEKRNSTVQKTAISMTAISGKDIQSRGIADFDTLAREVPSLDLKTSGPGQTEFELRGLSSSGGASPTVGFYLDNSALTAPANAQNGKVVIDPNLYDINRVEVLRGPQGTLYGAGSMGGTIRIITNQPKADAYDASVQSVLSGTDGGGFNHAENIMANVPIIPDVLALRMTGSQSYTSGWIGRVVAAPYPVANGSTRGDVLAAPATQTFNGVNDAELEGARLAIAYTPTPDLSITPMVFYQGINQKGESTFDSPPGTQAHYQPFDEPEPFSDNFLLAGLSVRDDVGSVRLNSDTAYWSRHETNTQDQSEQLQFAFGLPGFATSQGGVGPANITEYDTSKQFSEELRASSNGTGPWQWLLGAYYSDFQSADNLTSIVPGAAALFGTTDLIEQTQPIKIQQYALFGETSYMITSKLKLTTGLRWYTYATTLQETISGIVSPSGGNGVTTASASEKAYGFNPKIDLSYRFSDALLAYTTVSRGFRPGAGNQPVPISGGDTCLPALRQLGLDQAPLAYGPDHVWTYELGEKSHPFVDWITLNGAVYYTDWTGVQQPIALSCGFNFTDNSGNAQVYGTEWEASAQLTSAFSISANTAWTYAAFTANNPLTGAYRGEKLLDVPAWTHSEAITYRAPIADGISLFARLSNDYVGPRRDVTAQINNLPDYDIVSLRVGVAGGKWSATLFGNNLANKRAYLSDVTALSLNLPTFNRVASNQPLTVGIDLSYHY